MKPEDTEDEDRPLTEDEVLSEGLLVEAAGPRLIVPKKGKVFEEDGTCKVAIIRPCVSRGRRIRGLPPIYTPSMLAENASVFSGWLMYMDHLQEEVMVEGVSMPLLEAIAEAMAKRQRSIKELGGRVTASHYDPELVFEDDDSYGYQKGGVVGRALPRRVVREMLEDDPQLLHVSINAYPRGVKPGVAPWDASARGMLIEGIRGKPAGTVDWVPRGGAGGRVLQELEVVLERLAETVPTVSPEGRSYPSDAMRLADLNRDQLVAKLRAENPELAEELGLQESSGSGGGTRTVTTPPAGGSGGISQEELDRRLAEQRDTLLAESEGTIEERATELIQERAVLQGLAEKAQVQIKASGLPADFQSDLLRRWSLLPSGPTAALGRIPSLQEADGSKSVEELLESAVKADLDHAGRLIEAARGGSGPRVRGLGGGNGGAEHGGRRRPAHNAFRDFLRESGDLPAKLPDGKSEDDLVREMLVEGVSD
jgi:hypothetical protein